MSGQTRAVTAAGVLATSVLLLAGCLSEPQYPSSITDADASAAIKERVAEQRDYLEARFPDAELPEFDFIVVHDQESYWDGLFECVQQQGAGELMQSDYLGLTAEEQTTLEFAQGVCTMQHQIDPRHMDILSTAQLEFLYDHLVTTTVPCMELHGYTVSAAPPKSNFVEQNGWNWNPYSAVTVLPLDEARLLEFRCPQLPSDPFAGFFPDV